MESISTSLPSAQISSQRESSLLPQSTASSNVTMAVPVKMYEQLSTNVSPQQRHTLNNRIATPTNPPTELHPSIPQTDTLIPMQYPFHAVPMPIPEIPPSFLQVSQSAVHQSTYQGHVPQPYPYPFAPNNGSLPIPNSVSAGTRGFSFPTPTLATAIESPSNNTIPVATPVATTVPPSMTARVVAWPATSLVEAQYSAATTNVIALRDAQMELQQQQQHIREKTQSAASTTAYSNLFPQVEAQVTQDLACASVNNHSQPYQVTVPTQFTVGNGMQQHQSNPLMQQQVQYPTHIYHYPTFEDTSQPSMFNPYPSMMLNPSTASIPFVPSPELIQPPIQMQLAFAQLSHFNQQLYAKYELVRNSFNSIYEIVNGELSQTDHEPLPMMFQLHQMMEEAIAKDMQLQSTNLTADNMDPPSTNLSEVGDTKCEPSNSLSLDAESARAIFSLSEMASRPTATISVAGTVTRSSIKRMASSSPDRKNVMHKTDHPRADATSHTYGTRKANRSIRFVLSPSPSLESSENEDATMEERPSFQPLVDSKYRDGELSHEAEFGCESDADEVVVVDTEMNSPDDVDIGTDEEFTIRSTRSRSRKRRASSTRRSSIGSDRSLKKRPFVGPGHHAMTSISNRISRYPLFTVFVKVRQMWTQNKDRVKGMRVQEQNKLVLVPVRFVVTRPDARLQTNAITMNDLFVIAKDICVLIHKRKGSVAKSIYNFEDCEKVRVHVCSRPREAGRGSGVVGGGVSNSGGGASTTGLSTQVLTALSYKGLLRLMKHSRSSLASHVQKWILSVYDSLIKNEELLREHKKRCDRMDRMKDLPAPQQKVEEAKLLQMEEEEEMDVHEGFEHLHSCDAEEDDEEDDEDEVEDESANMTGDEDFLQEIHQASSSSMDINEDATAPAVVAKIESGSVDAEITKHKDQLNQPQSISSTIQSITTSSTRPTQIHPKSESKPPSAATSSPILSSKLGHQAQKPVIQQTSKELQNDASNEGFIAPKPITRQALRFSARLHPVVMAPIAKEPTGKTPLSATDIPALTTMAHHNEPLSIDSEASTISGSHPNQLPAHEVDLTH